MCKECGYKSSRRSDMVTRSKIHTDEKPFVCSECGYKCAVRYHLVTHKNSYRRKTVCL